MKKDRGYEKLYKDLMKPPQDEEEIMKLQEEAEIIEPPENIDEYILKGVMEGRKYRKKRRLRVGGTLVAAFASIFFVSMIYLSPAFAKSMSNIPGLNYIVELVYRDKGLKAAVEKDFVISVNETIEHKDIVITVKDVIIDATKAEVFYQLSNKSEIYDNVFVDEVEFFDETGKKLNLSYFITTVALDSNGKNEGAKTLSVYFINEESEIPEELTILMKVRNQKINEEGVREEGMILEDTWRFSFDIDRDKLLEMVEEIEINKTIEIEGQKVIFKRAKITPTMIGLVIGYPEDNSKVILSFEDIELVNEKGEVWGRPQGLTGVGIGAENNEITLYFQSNYFSDSKELYVRGASARALDKDKLEVVLDLDKEEVIKAPDSTLRFTVEEHKEDSITLNYSYQDTLPKLYDKNGEEIYTQYNIFSYSIKDSRGEPLEISSMGNYGGEGNDEGLRRGSITIDTDKEIQGPITLKINDYPDRIQEEFKVRIK